MRLEPLIAFDVDLGQPFAAGALSTVPALR
jgi:hypothetical protein